MNDEHVDELLADLDRALSVQPSPAVVARVRTEIAKRPARDMVWVRWAALAGIAGAAIVAVTMWMARENNPLPVQEAHVTAAEANPVAAPAEARPQLSAPAPDGTPVAVAPRTRVTAVNRVVAASRPARVREPEVLVPPDAGIAFEQLRAGIASGRITAAAFSSELPEITPTMVVPTVIEIAPFGSDPSNAPTVPSGLNTSTPEEILASTTGPLSRTRSSL